MIVSLLNVKTWTSKTEGLNDSIKTHKQEIVGPGLNQYIAALVGKTTLVCFLEE